MLVFLALVLGWTVRDYEQLMHQEKRLASGAMDAYIKLLQARRHEKDFLLRLDDTYVDKQTKAVAELRSTVQELAGLPLPDAVLQPVEKEATAMSVGAIFAALAPEIDAYQTSFTAMVEANRKRGLTAEAGAQKVFREAAHFLEKSLSPDDDRIMVLLLQVRRSEKDYMLRLRSEGEKYRSRTLADLDRLETAAGALPGNGAKAAVAACQNYRAGFLNLVACDGEIATAEKALRQAIHKVEGHVDMLHEGAEILASERSAATAAHAANWRLAAVIIAICGMVLALIVVARRAAAIARPVVATADALKLVAAGDFRQPAGGLARTGRGGRPLPDLILRPGAN